MQFNTLSPFGCIVDFTNEINQLLSSMSNMQVFQQKSISGIASMGIRGESWEIELGS